MTQRTNKEVKRYHHIDHTHCWKQKNPPCGQKIKHFECCLCQMPHPDVCGHPLPTNSGDEELKEKLNEWFPKGESKERGQAMLLLSEILATKNQQIAAVREETLKAAVSAIEGEVKKLQRYNMESDGACGDPECCGMPEWDMWENEDGEYVKYSDLTAITTLEGLVDKKTNHD